MVNISFDGKLQDSNGKILEYLGISEGDLTAVAGFFGCITAIAFIEKQIPSTAKNPHEIFVRAEMKTVNGEKF